MARRHMNFFVMQEEQQSQVILKLVRRDFPTSFHRALIKGKMSRRNSWSNQIGSIGIEIRRFCSFGKSIQQLFSASSGVSFTVLYQLRYARKQFCLCLLRIWALFWLLAKNIFTTKMGLYQSQRTKYSGFWWCSDWIQKRLSQLILSERNRKTVLLVRIHLWAVILLG